jgi:hypothetical protein
MISFTHKDRTLPDLLLQVVFGDVAAQAQALGVLQAWHCGVSSMDTELDDCDEYEMTRERERFQIEVERTVLTPSFPAAEFIRGLVAIIQGKHDDWLEQHRRSSDRRSELMDRYFAEPSTPVKELLKKQICEETDEDLAAADALLTGAYATSLFQSLGAGLLLSPDAVRILLSDPNHRFIACNALALAGTKAAPEFLEELLALPNPEFDSATIDALIAVGGDDPRVARFAAAPDDNKG